MIKRIYYDTNAFWRFFNLFIENIPLTGKIKKYYPLNSEENIIKITAPWTLDEFFHSYIAEKRNEIFFPFFKSRQISNRIEKLSKTNEYLALFKQETVDTMDINLLFIKLFLLSRNHNILSLKSNDHKIDSKDLLHLSYALYSKCHSLITCDKGFKFLKNVRPIKEIFQYYKLKKIIVIKEDLSGISQEFDFSI